MNETTETSTPRPTRSKWIEVAGRVVRGLAVAYLVALVTIVAAFRLVGERWWATTIGLYLPAIGFGLPLPFLTLALVVTRSWRVLLTQLAAALVLVFPLMGLQLAGDRAPTAGAHHFRIFTANAGLEMIGVQPMLDRIRDVDADVVVLEEVSEGDLPALRAGLAGYAFRSIDQFVIASRFPIEDAALGAPVRIAGELHTSHYASCRLQTAGGPVRLFAVHPVSPHDAFDRLRGEGLRGEIRTGRVWSARSRAILAANTGRRLAELKALAADADAASEPVVIAGDTNLPGLSWALGSLFGRYRDAFSEVGSGFGYTYPAQRRVWMRIDRILADPRFFNFLHAAVLSPRVSQHLALTADLEMRPRPR